LHLKKLNFTIRKSLIVDGVRMPFTITING
jgi:hypothetical protein